MKWTNIPKNIRAELVIDEHIFGNAYCLKNSDKTWERLDPLKVIIKSDGTFIIKEKIEMMYYKKAFWSLFIVTLLLLIGLIIILSLQR